MWVSHRQSTYRTAATATTTTTATMITMSSMGTPPDDDDSPSGSDTDGATPLVLVVTEPPVAPGTEMVTPPLGPGAGATVTGAGVPDVAVPVLLLMTTAVLPLGPQLAAPFGHEYTSTIVPGVEPVSWVTTRSPQDEGTVGRPCMKALGQPWGEPPQSRVDWPKVNPNSLPKHIAAPSEYMVPAVSVCAAMR